MTIEPVRILIVDDHFHSASMLAQALSKLETPTELMTAQSGEEALKLIGNRHMDILITDFMLTGMNGLDLIEKLDGEKKPPYIILVTAYDAPGLKITADRLKVDDYLLKPVQPDQIREKVAGFISKMNTSEIGIHKLEDEPTPSKILIADDNPDNVRLLSVRLQSEGYQFIPAYDGMETLDKLRMESPDLVLLDVNMPRKDGFEVLVEMRSDPQISHIPVIVVTAARIGAKDVREGLTLGADDYVTKPVDWRELSARIRTKLRVKKAEDNLRQRNKALGVLPEISKDLSVNLDLGQLTASILERSVEALGASNGYLFVFHSDGRITQQIQSPFDVSPWSWEELTDYFTADGFVQQVIESRQGILVKNTLNEKSWIQIPNDPTHSAVVIPLTGRHEVLGILVLTHQKSDYFTTEHMRIVEAIASQAAVAIENAQLYVMERKRVDELVALNQLTRQISHFTRSAELFEVVPSLVRQFLGYPAVALWSYLEGKIHLLKIDGEENAPRSSLLELGPQQVTQTGQPIQFSGPIDERTGERFGKGQPPILSTIAVPIHWNGCLQGVLSSVSLKPGTFQESDRVIMETLASQLGNVLERISLFESIEQEQKRLSAVLNTAADAILVISPEGNLQIINPAGEKLFTDVTVQIDQTLPAGRGYDGLIKIIQKAHNSGNLEKAEINWPDNRTFSLIVAPIAEGGEVAVLHDVSHFMTINQLKNEFLATASHDLKNPIFSVLGYSNLIERAGSLNEMQFDFLRRIRNAANQMQDLVLNLLEFARIEMETDLQKEKISLDIVLKETFEEYRSMGKEKNHLMILELPEKPIPVFGDRMRLQQVVRNLLSNAIKYTPAGGNITMSSIFMNGKVRVDIRDTGIGIPEEAIPNLFQKFYRVHTDATQDIEGNGLGLAIVKSILEQHDGDIRVKSKEGEGSCFSFSLAVIPT